MIWELLLQDRSEANLGHPGPSQYALPLQSGGSRDNDDVIASPLGTGFKKKGNIENRERLVTGAGRG